MQSIPIFILLLFFSLPALPQDAPGVAPADEKVVPLTVSSGVPLRLYLTKRLTKRLGEPAEAKLLDAVFAFDRQVVPAGAVVSGHVVRLDSMGRWARISAILNGDFTPLHRAQVEFTELVLPDGKKMAIQTAPSMALNSIYNPTTPKKKKKAAQPTKPGVLGIGKQEAQARINAAMDQALSVPNLVRSPDKKERLEDYLVQKLPYRPQWIRKGTRFDAALSTPLRFGEAKIKTKALELLATPPPPDSMVAARLVTPVDSGTAKTGQKIEAVVSRPLFSADQRLILPEGTHLSGAVTVARRARWLHRGGQLRFNFQRIDLPASVAPAVIAEKPPELKTQAVLGAAESTGPAPLKVDEEGGVKATEPKTRLLAPLVAWFAASQSREGDRDRLGGTQADANVSGRTMGGASGFGMVGAAAAQASRTAGTVFGFYGLAWSVYTSVLARGAEINFGQNEAMDIRFGGRPAPPPTQKFISGVATAASGWRGR